MTKAIQLNVTTIDHLLEQPKDSFEWIRFDSTNDCNLHCVYCHNGRSKELMDLRKLESFLENNVESAANFQFGCVMEPSLDKRLVDIMELVAISDANPEKQMVLQTNGILLHTHDQQRMVDAGLTDLSLSIDSHRDETFRILRGGAKLDKIFRNMKAFRENCPDVTVQFITTVNTANIGEIEELVDWGLEIGVGKFVLREMFYFPNNHVVNHDEMIGLVLPPGQFSEMKDRVSDKYKRSARFYFYESENLVDYSEMVREHSTKKKCGSNDEIVQLAKVA